MASACLHKLEYDIQESAVLRGLFLGFFFLL
jgi:hypothetical protein